MAFSQEVCSSTAGACMSLGAGHYFDNRLASFLCQEQPYDRGGSSGHIHFVSCSCCSMQYFDALYYRDDDVVRTVLISLWAGAEPVRIVAGYIGNLQEHDRTPVTNAVQVVQAVLLEINLLAGFHARLKNGGVHKRVLADDMETQQTNLVKTFIPTRAWLRKGTGPCALFPLCKHYRSTSAAA
eukprot:scaffold171309_cov19-Tisochrysis_lutea.AAC.1